ncbi:HNH endonuclease [Caballeronia zhejiangensis]|uniref:HNH endonuclease n=1 Tax=Caballeronia zhejiangensis TaxID=871203 RepID=UPI001F51D78F|nr:HNH endonuclease [Caballeronia zhejiangensis]MCI1046950.1 HNH endonuclease [Caballeronia zhejiangensis]
MPSLTQERLKSLLHYDPVTGVFTHLRNTSNKKAGEQAGWKRPDGYLQIGIDRKNYYAHRLAILYMTGKWPKKLVDHINRNPLDNSYANLREATPSQNRFNSAVRKDNTSGYTGICQRGNGKWAAYIAVEKKRMCLGNYADIQDAVKAVAEARQKYHGEFAPKQ